MSHACTHHVDREQVVRSRVIQHGLKLCLQLGRVDSVDALVTRAHHEHVDQRVQQPTDCKQDPVSIVTAASGDNTTTQPWVTPNRTKAYNTRSDYNIHWQYNLIYCSRLNMIERYTNRDTEKMALTDLRT